MVCNQEATIVDAAAYFACSTGMACGSQAQRYLSAQRIYQSANCLGKGIDSRYQAVACWLKYGGYSQG